MILKKQREKKERDRIQGNSEKGRRRKEAEVEKE